MRYRKAVPEARTKAQAEQAEVKAKEAVYQGKYGKEPSNITLREFTEKHFLPWSKSEKRSWRNDFSRSKPIIAFFRSKKMREITRFNVEQYRKERRESFNGRGQLRAPSSVDRELQLLSRIFSLAIERGLLDTNPCKGVKTCSVGNVVTRHLTAEEEQRLLAVMTGKRRHLRHIFLIGLYSGLRRSEILRLHRSQIDFVRDAIELRANQTKSGKPRSVPISPVIRDLLLDLVEGSGAKGYLFLNPKTGKPIGDIKSAWQAAVKEAGIEHARFHDVRHSFGTRAADRGAHVKDIKEVMGHADVHTTMRYVHATDEGKRRVVEAAGNVASLLPHKKTAAG